MQIFVFLQDRRKFLLYRNVEKLENGLSIVTIPSETDFCYHDYIGYLR